MGESIYCNMDSQGRVVVKVGGKWKSLVTIEATLALTNQRTRPSTPYVSVSRS